MLVSELSVENDWPQNLQAKREAVASPSKSLCRPLLTPAGWRPQLVEVSALMEEKRVPQYSQR